MQKKTKTHFLTGKDLRREIWHSKLSYCSYIDLPQDVLDCEFAYSGTSLPDNMTGLVRVFTSEHIPDDDSKSANRRKRSGKVWVNFEPFKIYLDGDEIVRSHWDGGFDNGHFTIENGKLNRMLVTYIQLLVNKYAKKPNWSGYSYLEDMKSSALESLCRGILQFNDFENQNSFAYATTIMNHAFLKVFQVEKKVQRTRDRMLFDMGANPSFNWEADEKKPKKSAKADAELDTETEEDAPDL